MKLRNLKKTFIGLLLIFISLPLTDVDKPFVPRKELKAANIYLFKVNNRNNRKRGEICSQLTIKTPERRH